MKKYLLLYLFLVFPVTAQEITLPIAKNAKKEYVAISETGIINVFFNKSVDTNAAIYKKANGNIDFAQKLINRIDSAKYSIDVCVYSFSGTPNPGDDIANALIRAKERGVKIRFIIEEDNKNKVAVNKVINAGIPVLTDKCGANDGSGLMHNKFFIFDNRDNSTDLDDWTITGSWNPTQPGTYDDCQNIIEVRDKLFASAFTAEFDEMWGGAGDSFDVSKAKFGKNKTDNTTHVFNIGGIHVELYFSPSDGTLTKIVDRINNARHSINFSELTFTNDDAAIAIKNAYTNYKVNVRGIMDASNLSATGSKFEFFNSTPKWASVIKSNYPTGFFHHKYMIIDGEKPSDEKSWVLTGSYNITNSAEYYNNENLVFIRNADIANQYLQEFVKRFSECGGIFTSVDNCSMPEGFQLSQNYPNPFNPETRINYTVSKRGPVELKIYDALGREVETLLNENKAPGNYSAEWRPINKASGVYYYILKSDKNMNVRKMIYVR